MTRIALTGGIASGKSFVADELAARGAVIVDSDVLAREVVEPGTVGLERIRERFGDEILKKDGSLNRPKLGELIFADDAARADLNAIVHPLVREAAEALTAQAAPGSVVIQVIPLLVETGLDKRFDKVIVVDIPQAIQESRLMRRGGFDRDAARQRIRAQAAPEQRLAVADWVIDNGGTKAQTRAQVDALWSDLVG